MLYTGDKGVNDAARLLKGGPAKVRSLSASSMALLDNAHLGQSQQQIDSVGFIPVGIERPVKKNCCSMIGSGKLISFLLVVVQMGRDEQENRGDEQRFGCHQLELWFRVKTFIESCIPSEKLFYLSH